MRNYVVLFDWGMKIVPDYDSWGLSEYVEDAYDMERLDLPEELSEMIFEELKEKFPNIEEDYEIYYLEDLDEKVEEDILEYAEELIHKHYGYVIDKWALRELEDLSENVKETKKYLNNPEGFLGLNREKD